MTGEETMKPTDDLRDNMMSGTVREGALLRVDDGFAIQLEHHSKHAVRRRVLRAHRQRHLCIERSV